VTAEAGFASLMIVSCRGVRRLPLFTQITSPPFPLCRITQHVQFRTDHEPTDPARDLVRPLLLNPPHWVILHSWVRCSGPPVSPYFASFQVLIFNSPSRHASCLRVGQGLPNPAPRTTVAGPGREPSGVPGRAHRTPARGGKNHAHTPMDQALSQALPTVSGSGAGRRRGRGALFGPPVLLSGACGQGRSQSLPSHAGIPPPACRPAWGQPAAARGRPPTRGEGSYPRTQTNHRDELRSGGASMQQRKLWCIRESSPRMWTVYVAKWPTAR
jgi:hypothetical protein